MQDPFWPAGKRAAVSLSFDDARESQIDRGMTILNRHNFKATFYVSMGSLGKRLDDWKKAVVNGHEIGNHTLTHPCSGNYRFSRPNALENYTLETIESDILAANEKIQSLLDVKPQTFAYPCGQTFVGRGAQQKSYVPVIAKHFLIGRTAFDEMPNHPSICDLAHAFAMEADGASMDKLKWMIDLAREDSGWLILLAHDVGAGSRQAITENVLSDLFAYLNDSPDLWCGTVQQIGQYISDQREG